MISELIVLGRSLPELPRQAPGQNTFVAPSESQLKIFLKQWGGISESKPREQKASALSSENSILIVSVS